MTAYVCAPCACGAHRGQKMASDPLGVELQMVVSFHVGAGNQTWAAKSIQGS